MVGKIAIPSDLEAARRLSAKLLAQVNRMGCNEDYAFAIRLALEEALNNAVKHGNKCDPAKVIEVSYDIDPHRAEITVTDQGCGFDSDSLPDPRADENLEKPSGRGVMLMRAYMDEVHFARGGSQVTMIKRGPQTPQGPDGGNR